MIIGFSKAVHVWIITMVFQLLLVNLQIKRVRMSQISLYSWRRRRIWCIDRSKMWESASVTVKNPCFHFIFTFYYIVYKFSWKLTRARGPPSVNLNEGASNVQVMFDPNPLNKCCIVHFCKLQMYSNRDNAVLLRKKEKIMFCFSIRVIVAQRLLGNILMLLSHLHLSHLLLTCYVVVIWLEVWKSWTNTTSVVCRTDATMPSFYFGGALEKNIH